MTRAADATPVSSGPSLTALAEIGVTGILVNMFLTALGTVAAHTNNVLYNASTGTLDAGSDTQLSSNLNIHQLRWDNGVGVNHFALNSDGTGHLGNFFTGNSNQSVYLIFANGTYVELTPTDFTNAARSGNTWARWDVTDATILALLNGLSTTSDLVVGVADAGSIGWAADAGSDTETFTAAPLSIEAIHEQFITVGTEDYDLVIDIGGNPDTVEATGHMEGFIQHWDAANKQLHIKSDEVTRLISGVQWDIAAVRDTQTLMGKIAYNVIRAAPIFETLETLHLYRGVPINFDITIENIPALLIPNARLLGLKSELLEYGLNVKGSIDATANFTVNTGNIKIIVPSETGGDDTVHNFAYEIESGSPPTLGTPTFTPKGDFGELAVADVNHALGYEWTLGKGDAAVWHPFSDARPVINPSQIAVTPGDLNVTLQFPNITGASSYAYRLTSASHEVDWTRFTGTLANGMITTIIPDLQEGVAYTLQLRVGSPWVGAPVSLTIYGGRLLYLLNYHASGSEIFIGSTGVADSGIMPITKRIGLPTAINTKNVEGLAVSGHTAYVSDRSRNVYVLNINVNDGATATLSRQFTVNNKIAEAFTASRFRLAVKGNVLYAPASNDAHTFSALTAAGTVAAPINTYVMQINQIYSGIAVRDDTLLVLHNPNKGNGQISVWPESPVNYGNSGNLVKTFGIRSVRPAALGLTADFVYAVQSNGELRRISLNTPPNNYPEASSDEVREVGAALLANDIRDISFPE